MYMRILSIHHGETLIWLFVGGNGIADESMFFDCRDVRQLALCAGAVPRGGALQPGPGERAWLRGFLQLCAVTCAQRPT